MKKDGFTLIEILLVLVILVTVSVAGTFAIQNIQKKSNEERLSELYKEIESATDVYLSENDAFLKDILNKEVDEKCIRIYTLQNEGLLSNTLTNPVTNKLIPANLCVMVYMKSDGTISSAFNESDEKKTITLNVINGTSDNSTKSGYNKVVFNVTPNEGYLSELETNTCNGTLSGNEFTITDITDNMNCSISFKKSTLYGKLLADKTERSVTTRPGGFSSVYTSDNTKTLYTSTENGTTVYYFAGNATDNWVKFGKYEKDFVVYRGYSSSTSTYYSEYQTLEACTSASSYNVNCTLYKFASAGDDIYWRIIRTNADGGIRLLYHSTSPTSEDAYLGKTTFNSVKTDAMYVGYMYGTSGTLESNRTNDNDSTIKTVIDTWYENNLKTNYGKYLSTTAIYCNDRKVAYSTTGTIMDYYEAYERLNINKTPTYDCTNTNDKFTVSTSAGNGKLENPIALMTADEISFAGGLFNNNAPAYYYKNGSGNSSTGKEYWWTMTPYIWNSSNSFGSGSASFFVRGSEYPGTLVSTNVTVVFRARPVTSLKSCVKWASGDGTPENPYTIDESYTC